MGDFKWDVLTGHRSVSQLGTMSDCGHAYFLQKVVRTPQRNATWFVQGSAVHGAVDAYESTGRAMSAEEAVSRFEATWDLEMEVAWKKQPDPKMWMVGGKKSVETDMEQRLEKGRQQTIDYVSANGPDDEWLPTELMPGMPATEVGFELDFDGVRVIGYIDLVLENQLTGALKVRDIKTGTKMPEGPYQFATYKIAVEELTGQPVDQGDYWMCKDNKAAKAKDLRMYTRDLVGDWYKSMDKMIKDGNFLANPVGCFTCTVRPYCKHEVANPIPWPPEMPVGLDVS